MNPIRTAAPLLAVALIAACAAPTPYQAATERNGFSELKIEDDRFSVSFRGNSRTPRETVETYLLHRAAELTLASGGEKSSALAGDRTASIEDLHGEWSETE